MEKKIGGISIFSKEGNCEYTTTCISNEKHVPFYHCTSILY